MNAHQSNLPLPSLIQDLREKIRQVEVAGRNDDGTVISSGTAAMDSLLPAGGYNRGTIIHWCGDAGSGADFLSLLAAKNAAQSGGAIVVIDPQQQFYPPAARALGMSLGNLIVLRGPELLWAIEQSLQCSAVAAVWGPLPDFKTAQLATLWQRRFQLAAESSGCCGMFVKQRRTIHCRQQRSPISSPASSTWAEVQWQLRPLATTSGTGDTRLIRSTLARCRGGTTGQVVDLEINTITGNVQLAHSDHATSPHSTTHPLSLAAQLAHPKTNRRAAGA